MPGEEHSPHTRPAGSLDLLEAYSVSLDPVLYGFSGVLVELYAAGSPSCYEVRLTASATGDRLLVFTSRREEIARSVFEGESEGVRRGPTAIG